MNSCALYGAGRGGLGHGRMVCWAASSVREGRNIFVATSFYRKDTKPTQDPFLQSE